jgi:hypothetical protein
MTGRDLRGARNEPLRGSGDQASAALGATGIQDPPTVLGRAASAETVGPGTLEAAGLERAFHDRYSESRRPGLVFKPRLKRRGNISNFGAEVNAETAGGHGRRLWISLGRRARLRGQGTG